MAAVMVATAGLSLADKVGLAVTVISAVGAAVASCLAAWRSAQTRKSTQPPSDGINSGAVTENTNVVLRQLLHLVAEEAGRVAAVPTPADTQAQAPGSTLLSPPPAPTPVAPPATPAPGP